MKKLAVILSVLASASVANGALNIVTNGDFSNGLADWGFAGVGAGPTSSLTGGNPDGYGTIDQTAGGWGGVLINDNDSPASLASLGLVAGDTYTFSIDMINLGSGAPVAGMKIENWNAGLISDSGNITFAVTSSWDTYTFSYTVDPAATGLKFVPLLVVQPVGSSVGFDNVGVEVVPEPTSSVLLGLGALGLLARRRR